MTPGPRSAVIHGHFYQPPREDPWTDTVPRQPSAAPFHDWNERVERECYSAVTAARTPEESGHFSGVVNALAWMSFDFGPTLLYWLERAAPETYGSILEADRLSQGRVGHGGAIALPYHHTILPLASRRDKVTEVRWGVADFRRRFAREPEGMWLPEAAVDDETLDVLAQEGIGFTVVGPEQVEEAPGGGLPGMYRTRSGGREIAIFVYDGELSHGVAYGPLLKDPRAWAERMAVGASDKDPLLVAMATDGETFGHHHEQGEIALASVIDQLVSQGARVENFASFLARHPPTEAVALIEPSSWSCVHGVERWRSDCGCKLAVETASEQTWRAPLREAMDWLAGRLHEVFEAEGRQLFGDPWKARNDYGAVVPTAGTDAFEGTLREHLDRHATRPLTGRQSARAAELLELERNALRLFTSCGWFFDDIAGIEAVQLLRYAARAIELSGDGAAELEAGFQLRLARAESNDPTAGNGREVYAKRDMLPSEVG